MTTKLATSNLTPNRHGMAPLAFLLPRPPYELPRAEALRTIRRTIRYRVQLSRVRHEADKRQPFIKYHSLGKLDFGPGTMPPPEPAMDPGRPVFGRNYEGDTFNED